MSRARGKVSAAILGHAPILARLRAAAASDRLPHALLFSGPEGVGKRTVACAFARELLCGDDPAARARFDRGAHDRFLLYSDLARSLPVRRRELLGPDLDEEALLAAYEILEAEGWISGVEPVRGADVIDLLRRNPDRFTGRKGIPFADILEKELASLSRARKSTPSAVEVARRLFSSGTSRAPYRRNLGIELINGKGDGEHFRTIDSLLRTSSGGKWRIAVLDDAHRMTGAAANAFLKTLEEPPPCTLLILVTSEPLSLLSTTRSRCAKVVFDAVPREELAGFLTGTQGVAAEAAPLLATLAEGSVRRALELRGLDFAARRRFLEELLPRIAAGDLRAVLALAGSRLASAADGKERPRNGPREEVLDFLELLCLCFRDLALAGAMPGVSLVSGMDPGLAADLSHRFPAATWEKLFERAQTAARDVHANVEPRVAVESLFAETLPRPGAPA